MTSNEQKTVDLLLKVLSDLRNENSIFRETAKRQIESLESRIDAKHYPVNLEQEILRSAQQGITESIKAALGGFNSPLHKLTNEVVSEQSTFLRQVISESFNSVIRTDDFKQSIVNAFSHKVARSVISNNDGLFDKVANDLKQDAVFKAKMALAVSNVVNECLNERNA